MAIHLLDDVSKKVLDLRVPGTHADGKGLYLRVRAEGQGSWTVKFGTKERSIGPADLIKIDAARELHRLMRLEAHAGRDPWALLTTKAIIAGHAVAARALPEMVQASDLPAGVTRLRFADAVECFLKNSPAAQKFGPRSTAPRQYRKLKTGTLGTLWADEITSAHVVAELKARWADRGKLDTAEKQRMNIGAVCTYARAKGYRAEDAPNPADNDIIKNLIPKPPKAVPHASLPVAECPAFFAELAADATVQSRALRFLMLTAGRTGEIIGADWSEVEGNVWHIPASRMKEGAINGDHWVPLSDTALALLGTPKKSGLIWGHLPDDALDDKLKEYRAKGVATNHGFRGSFNGFCAKAGYSDKLIDHALHHAKAHGDTKAKRTYSHEALIEERRPMQVAWSDFLTTKDTTQ